MTLKVCKRCGARKMMRRDKVLSPYCPICQRYFYNAKAENKLRKSRLKKLRKIAVKKQ